MRAEYAVAISAGGRHSLVLAEDESVWATGDNGFGQLGNGGPISLDDLYVKTFTKVLLSGQWRRHHPDHSHPDPHCRLHDHMHRGIPRVICICTHPKPSNPILTHSPACDYPLSHPTFTGAGTNARPSGYKTLSHPDILVDCLCESATLTPVLTYTPILTPQTDWYTLAHKRMLVKI